MNKVEVVNSKKTSLLQIAYPLIPEIIRSVFQAAYKKLLELVQYLSGKSRDLKDSVKIRESNRMFLTNSALLNEIKEGGGSLDRNQRERLDFLSVNYLAKAAPDLVEFTKNLHQNVELQSQVGESFGHIYHRTMTHQELGIESKINQKLGLGEKSPLILTDTTEIAHLFPLKFIPLQKQNFREKVIGVLKNHFQQGVMKPFSDPLATPFLFDLTDQFGESIKTGGDARKETEFSQKIIDLRKELQREIDSIVTELTAHAHLQGHSKKLRVFIEKSITCICRVQIEDNIAGIKVLPLFADLKGKRLLKAHPELIDFVDSTGILMGAVNMRRYLYSQNKARVDVRWFVPARNHNSLGNLTDYYLTKQHFTGSALFKRLSDLFKTEPKPHIQVLGKATMDLLQGLMDKIDESTWNRWVEDPVDGQIALCALLKIREHLAMAELHKIDFTRFAQEIELVHAEIATMLELVKPFELSDFSEIYRETVQPLVPEGLQLTAGLGKTAMNTFAGINAALLKQSPHLHRTYGSGVYYEEIGLIGYNHSFEEMEKDLEAPQVNLYVGQFNPNVTIDPALDTYTCGNISQDLHYLLDHNKAAEHLTVAIDCTIDQFDSEKVKKILEEFKKEIEAGKLNFIFFHSGQKLDMFGMDNYYGSPFYMVNNGGQQWKEFTALQSHPVHQPDPLSLQWFCLSHQCAKDSLSPYRELIFKNARYILDRIPESLKPTGLQSQKMKINQADQAMKATFIDIKLLGSFHKIRSFVLCGTLIYLFFNHGLKLQCRASFGFYHANITTISAEMNESSTVRLNPGINPEENDLILSCLNQLAGSM